MIMGKLFDEYRKHDELKMSGMSAMGKLLYTDTSEFKRRDMFLGMILYAESTRSAEDFYNAFLGKIWEIEWKDLRKNQVDGVGQFKQGLLNGTIDVDAAFLFLETQRTTPKLSSKLK